MTSTKRLSFEEKFLRWRKEHKLKGPDAMSRYAFFLFVEAITKVSDDFVLKGGNLLWIYTKTPRETMDLDFSTINLGSHLEIREVLDKALSVLEDVTFTIEGFKEMNHENIFGAKVKISYKSNSGATNKFSVDIIYKLTTDLVKVDSPILKRKISAASIENIICDKLNAVLTKITYSTRIKDYDDLWRISKSGIKVDSKKLSELLKLNKIESSFIDYMKIGEITKNGWIKHLKRYKDLPDLEVVVEEVNHWLKEEL